MKAALGFAFGILLLALSIFMGYAEVVCKTQGVLGFGAFIVFVVAVCTVYSALDEMK